MVHILEGLKVKPAVKVHGGNDVFKLESGNDALNSSDVLLFRVRGTGTCFTAGGDSEEEPVVAFGATPQRGSGCET